MACTRSGLVMVLDGIFWETPDREVLCETAVRNVNEMGPEARITGKPCPGCRVGPEHPFIGPPSGLSSVPTCEYRPLQGPLFVPRPI
ncbi:MAG: hypothetical protein ACREDF_04020 [Thermoplasmata archaeon]